LAFDVLVPMLWIMLVLTAITAVQRFVKVWRQASPERTRRTRHQRGPGTDEPRAGSLAQWWAAHRPQTEKSQVQKTGGPGAPRRR
jgi:CDP-diacylglycerol--glycerol-3-phosphate 3-phosphatidyltransferase